MTKIEEIIERLNNIARHAIHRVGEQPFVMSLDDGLALHSAIDILRSAGDWTSCSEDLPKTNGRYLVTVHPNYAPDPSCSVDDIIWLDGKWQYIDRTPQDFPFPVIAWRPFPKPYVEDE